MRVISLLLCNASLIFYASLIIFPRLAARKHILTDGIGYNPHLMEDRRELSAAKLCDLMMLQRKQRKICRRDKGVAHTLYESTELAKFECDRQFRRERWNCSLAEKYRLNILKKGKSFVEVIGHIYTSLILVILLAPISSDKIIFLIICSII